MDVKGFWQRIQADDVLGVAAEMAYGLILSLAPLLLFIVGLFGLLGNALDLFTPIITTLQRVIPPAVMQVVRPLLGQVIQQLSAPQALPVTVISLAGSLWAASGSVRTFIKGLNRAYEVPETRPWWLLLLVPMAVVLTIGLALFLLVNLWMIGGGALGRILGFFGLPETWAPNRGLLGIIGVVLVMILYGLCPNWQFSSVGRRFSRQWPGAVTFMSLWLLFSWGFSLYVEHWASRNPLFGALGGIAALLLWLYGSAAVLMIGGELNAYLIRQRSHTPGSRTLRGV